MSLLRRRMMMQQQERDEIMQLEAPRLILTDTIKIVGKEYTWKSSDYPELRNLRWMMIIVEQKENSVKKGWCELIVNGVTIASPPETPRAIAIKCDSTKGFWESGYQLGENIYGVIDANLNYIEHSNIKLFAQYSPIEEIKIRSYQEILSEGTEVKIYGS